MNEEEFDQFLTAIERELFGQGGDCGSAMGVITAAVNALKGHTFAPIAVQHFKLLEEAFFPGDDVSVTQGHPKRELLRQVPSANITSRPYSFRDVHRPPKWRVLVNGRLLCHFVPCALSANERREWFSLSMAVARNRASGTSTCRTGYSRQLSAPPW
jgi:hypothetical protein